MSSKEAPLRVFGVSGFLTFGFHTGVLVNYWAAAQGSRTHDLHGFPPKKETGSSQKLWGSEEIKQFQYVFSSK